MVEDRKRRSSILKLPDGAKKIDTQKRKRVSFAPAEILHHFDAQAKKPKLEDLDLDAKENITNSSFPNKETDNHSINAIFGSSDLQLLFTDECDVKKQPYENDLKRPLNIADQFLASGERKIRRSQIGSALLDTSLTVMNTSLRRSPRIRKIKSLKLGGQTPGVSQPQSMDISEQVTPPVPEDNLFDLDDITVFKDNGACIDNKQETFNKCESANMEISVSAPQPVFESVNMEISVEPPEAKSELMDTSSLKDVEYSVSLVQKTRENQERILNLSHDLRSLLNMSISECIDIANQSYLAFPTESALKKPSESMVKTRRLRRELVLLKKFIANKREAVNKNTLNCQNRQFENETLSNFDLAKSCLYSKFLETDALKSSYSKKYSDVVALRNAKLDNLNALLKNCIKSSDLFKKLDRVFKHYSIHIFPLSQSKIIVFDDFHTLFHLVEFDSSFSIVSHRSSFLPSAEPFYVILREHITMHADLFKLPLTFNEFLHKILYIKTIEGRLRVLYLQLDEASVVSSRVKYNDQKIGFVCHSRGVASFVVWTEPLFNTQLSLSLKLLFIEELSGNIGELETTIAAFLDSKPLNVSEFFAFLDQQSGRGASTVSDL